MLFRSLGEGFVGGKDGRRLLISPCNKLEEQICALDVHGEVADLVNDEHLVLGQDPELVRQTVLHRPRLYGQHKKAPG